MYNRTMTSSTIYQLIGRSYLEGVSHGMQKAAAFEKQALGPVTLLKSLKGIASKGQLLRKTIPTLGRIEGRTTESIKMLEKLQSNYKHMNPAAAESVAAQLKDWRALSKEIAKNKTILGNVGEPVERMGIYHYPHRDGLSAGKEYANAILSRILGK